LPPPRPASYHCPLLCPPGALCFASSLSQLLGVRRRVLWKRLKLDSRLFIKPSRAHLDTCALLLARSILIPGFPVTCDVRDSCGRTVIPVCWHSKLQQRKFTRRGFENAI
jgi:hypothetical protein